MSARGALAAVVALALLAGAASPVSAQPTESDVFVAEGILALEDKKFDEALAHFGRALQREPDHVEALYYSGVAHIGRGKPADALPFLEKARAGSPGETSVAHQLGLAYFGLERYPQATPLLEEVFAREPTLDSLGYYVGFLRYRRQDHDGALKAFRAGRTTDPNIAQLTRLYTGLALVALGLPEQAAAEVEQALRLQPASPLTGPAERLRESISASTHARGRRFRAAVTVGGFHDDNVTARPEPAPGDSTVHDLRRPTHESWGELAAVRLEYDWLQRGPWEGTVAYSFFANYNNDLPSFNLLDHSGQLSLGYRTTVRDLPLVSTLQYAYDYLELDEQEFLQRHAVTLFSTLVEDAMNLTSAQLRIEVKEFSEERPLAREEFQDAVNWSVGLVHVLRFSQDRHFLRAGYRVDIDDTRGENLDYIGHRLSGGAQVTLPWGAIRLSYDAALHQRKYLHKHTTLPDDDPGTVRRQDNEYSHNVRVEVPLPGNFTLAGDYLGTINESRIAAFGYRRNVFTLSLGWSY